ncbi:MAG: extracellular solute-binding protein [Clostridia bacterium]|nr:extracellular solute-binding protein [Clostridia bacterium]
MSNTKSRKLLSLILAVLMAMSTLATAVFADTAEKAEQVGDAPAVGGGGDSLQDITELLSTLSYAEYIAQYPDATTPKPDGFKVELSEDIINKDETDADYVVIDKDHAKYGDLSDGISDGSAAILIGDAGTVTFNINAEKAGLYSLMMKYRPASPSDGKEFFPVEEGEETYQTVESSVSIQRTLYLNGKVPFSEARFVQMDKKWLSAYAEDGRFEVDQGGNELRPARSISYTWQEYVFTDSDGFHATPLQLYLEEGENTIALEAVRESVFLADIEFFKYEEPRKYEDVLAEYEKKGYKNFEGESFDIQAELASAVSSYSITPTSDPVSPSTEPQSAKATMRNMIYSSEVGDWIEYEIDFPESAIYTFVIRYRQDSSSNPVSRKILIDGKLPYDQAQYSKFDFGDNWQTTALTNGEETLKFYIEKGVHTVRFEVNLGEIADILRRVTAVQNALNADYLEIVRLTGAEPDEYRDYGFARVIPDVMRDLVDQGKELNAILDYLEENGELSASTSTLTQIADRVMKMGTDEDQIAKNLDSLKSDLSALGSWVTSMQMQVLEMDYIRVQSPDDDIPKAEGNFFQGAWYEIKKFFYSFVIDYNALAVNEDGEITGDRIEVWSQSSRDQVQIIKDLTDSKFTPESGVPVTVKLVAGGTLLPSVLAGIGPDVALDGMTSTSNAIASQAAGSIIDYAVRGAILPIEQLEGFDVFKSTIYEQAFEVVTLDDPDGVDHVYGVPVALEWNMMFYRRDILGSLGITIPETWDDVLASVPVLQFNNMDIGLTRDVTTYATMIYQSDGEFWADNGMRVNFDANTSLEAFEYMVNMFTQYSLPLNFDGVNRFRTGEIPLFLASYITYNNITIFATELAGLWGFDAIPGMLQDDGVTVNRAIVGNADAITMLRGCEAIDEAWTFMKWFAGAEFQTEYSNELVNLLGEAGMRTVASKGALAQLQWKKDDRDALISQAKDVICLRQYPGSYFITRYVDFAVNNAYNEGADPVEQLLGYITAINKEISRKRGEFGYETLEVGQTLAEKRLTEAETAIAELSEGDAEKYKDAIEAARDAIEAGNNADAIEAAASGLESANGELFSAIAGNLKDAAAALRSYK